MTADVGGRQFGDPPLLDESHGFSGVAMGGVGPGTNLHEHDRAAVEGDDVDVAAEDPLTAADDSVAKPPKVGRRLILAAAAEFVPGG